jgi:hypothetical protein
LWFKAQRKGREVVFLWDADRRYSSVLVNGRLAASMRPAVTGGRVLKGPVAQQLDLVWLEGAIEQLLNGVVFLRRALTPRISESDTSDGGRPKAEPHSMSEPESGQRMAISPRGGRSQHPPYPQLASLLCPLCGGAMILTLGSRCSEGLVCPPCARTQRASAALAIALIVSKMRQSLDVADDGLPADARSALAHGFEQLEQVEQALSGLGSGE